MLVAPSKGTPFGESHLFLLTMLLGRKHKKHVKSQTKISFNAENLLFLNNNNHQLKKNFVCKNLM